MEIIRFAHGEFVASALQGSHFPTLRSLNGSVLPEIAIVGKSNVGKSSLINHMLGTSNLARVSSTPGKTQTINFFAIDQKIALVDLPGYGYAKVPKEMRTDWSKSLEDYFEQREPLRLILLLIDIRRSASEEDIAMAKWSAHHRKPLIIVLTKSDKLFQEEIDRKIAEHTKILSQIDGILLKECVPFSIRERGSRERLLHAINQHLFVHAGSR